jgi:transposase
MVQIEEVFMITRIHGIDRHKYYSTISIVNREGVEERLINRCTDLTGYIDTLGETDAVVLESSNGSFYWADLMEKRGASVFIVDTRKFKIIKESWKKTDKEDARNLAWGLWVHLLSQNHKLPFINKPDYKIRELRRLFAQYQVLNEQIVKLKSIVQASLSDTGVILREDGKKNLFNPKTGKDYPATLKTTAIGRMAIAMNLDMIWTAERNKVAVQKQIILSGEYLQKEVELLISIKGVSPLVALAFLADVGDITRFSSQRKLNSYLGLAPNAKSSGGKSYDGHISKASRHLTRWILTQSVPHIINSSLYMQNYYDGLKIRRGAGRSRVAVMRKTVGTMRRMLLNGEKYRYCDEISYASKLDNYRRALEKLKKIA